MRQNKVEDHNVLSIHFEDLIYNYNDTTTLIKKFIGLDDNDRICRLLIPGASKNNTQLFNRYDDSDEICIIEKELREFLYDFSKVEKNDTFDDDIIRKSRIQ